MTDAELERKMPSIRWREPLPVSVTEDPTDPDSPVIASGYLCRYCLAHHGLLAMEVSRLPQTLEQFREHLKQEHKIILE